MTADVFVDTNVFLYAIDEDPASVAKRDRAQRILLNEDRRNGHAAENGEWFELTADDVWVFNTRRFK